MERIIAAALRIVDVQGPEALSMRKLGAELSVDPMAIYRHLPNKDALLKSLVSAVFSRMELKPDPQAPWRERISEWAYAYRDLVLSYPAFIRQVAANATMARAASGAIIEPLRSTLVDAGLSDVLVESTINTLVDFLHGYGLGAGGDVAASESSALPEAPDRDTSSKGTYRASRLDPEQSFAISLDIIVQGALSLQRDHDVTREQP